MGSTVAHGWIKGCLGEWMKGAVCEWASGWMVGMNGWIYG